MYFYRPSTPEDFPPFETLWARACAAVLLEHGAGRRCPIHTVDNGLILYDDGGGNSWNLMRLADGRGLLIGQDHECSYVFHDDGQDMLVDGPAWLPWDWLLEHESEENIGFVYWWDGHAWARPPYPDYVDDDGVGILLPQLFSVENLAAWLLDLLVGPPQEESARRLEQAMAPLLRAAQERTLTGEVLTHPLSFFPEQHDIAEVMQKARALGLTPRSSPTLVSPGHGKPLRPEIAFFSGFKELRLGDTLRRTEEIPGRPEPEGGPELARLVEWARRHRLGPDGRAVLVRDTIHAAMTAGPRGRELPEEEELWRALFEAETHPEHGGWLYARVEVTESGHTVRRAYDHWPYWWHEHACHPGVMGLNYSHVLWLQQRDPRWQPAWVALWRYTDPPLHVTEGWTESGGPAPSFPWSPLTPEERSEILDELRDTLVDGAEGEWTRLRLDVNALIDTYGALFRALRPDGNTERIAFPGSAWSLLTRLRSGAYERGIGTWYRALFTVHDDRTLTVDHDYDVEPEFGRRIQNVSYQMDFLYFPREVAHTPDWMRRKIEP